MKKSMLSIFMTVFLLSSFCSIWPAEIKIEMISIPGKNYSMGKFEVTQGQWRAIMGSNPSKFQNGDTFPVEQVSWNDCQTFIQKLNQQTGGNYRLPTEAEWKYACLGGTTGNRYGELDVIAWYDGNAGGSTHAVGQKQPNTYGLYDTLGNVWEWSQDKAGFGTLPVLRGGSWFSKARFVKVGYRYGMPPGESTYDLGFRLAMDNR